MKNLLLSLAFLAIASPSWGLGVTAGQITTTKLAPASVTTPKLHGEALDGYTADGKVLINVNASTFEVDQDKASTALTVHFRGIEAQKSCLQLSADDADDSADSWNVCSEVANGLSIQNNSGSGNVGIGTASPDGTLHAHTATAGAVTAITTADDLVVENSTNGGISILTPSGNTGAIYFGDEDSNQRAYIRYSHSGDSMEFNTAQAERMRIDSSGNVGIGTASPTATLQVTTNTAVMKFSSLSMGDDATHTMETNFGSNGRVTISDANDASCSWHIQGSGNAITVIDDADARCAEADSDGTWNMIADGDSTYTLKNRRGSARIVAIHFVGFE